MYLVKTLLGKILWDIKPSEGKRVNPSIFFNIILFITSSISSPSCKHTWLRWWSPILWTEYSKVLLSKDFANKYARFLHERIFFISTLPFLWRSWMKKNFGRICFILFPLIYHSFNWAIHALLSSYMVVEFIFLKDKPQVCHTCWIIDLNQTNSRLTSRIAKNSTWFDNIVFKKSFTCCCC